jgi:hypothetical protein
VLVFRIEKVAVDILLGVSCAFCYGHSQFGGLCKRPEFILSKSVLYYSNLQCFILNAFEMLKAPYCRWRIALSDTRTSQMWS